MEIDMKAMAGNGKPNGPCFFFFGEGGVVNVWCRFFKAKVDLGERVRLRGILDGF